MTPAADARGSLLEWYERCRRDLPWRRRADPYAVWVSEIMLQQTRVDTVVGYYDRFLERFPDVGALARASEEEVLAQWSGLGYYRRARLLHRAARELSAGDEVWPTGAAHWRRLPGVGEYTAAALASILDGEVTPVLDGNVERVLARFLAASGNPKHRGPRRRLAAAAQQLLDRQRPGDSNQALMELGATVCRPLHPLCHGCPLVGDCRAFAAGEPERYPPARRRRAIERVARRTFVVEGGDRGVWLVRRDDRDRLLAGFWEFPWIDRVGAGRAEDRLEHKYGGEWKVGEQRGVVRHSITHRIFSVTVESARHRMEGVAEAPGTPDRGFFTLAELDGLPTSSLTRKILAVGSSPRLGGAGEPSSH